MLKEYIIIEIVYVWIFYTSFGSYSGNDILNDIWKWSINILLIFSVIKIIFVKD